MNKILAFIMVMSLTGTTFGKMPDQKKFKADYPKAVNIAKCALCHDGAKTLNPFGQDYQVVGSEFTEALKKLDSDKDGFTNESEINADTFPGDFNSHPKATAYYDNQ